MPDFSSGEVKCFILHPSTTVFCVLYQMLDVIQRFVIEIIVIFGLKLYFHVCKPYQGLQVHVRKAQETESWSE